MSDLENNPRNSKYNDPLTREIFASTQKESQLAEDHPPLMLLPKRIESRTLIALPLLIIVIGFVSYIIGYLTMLPEQVHLKDELVGGSDANTPFANLTISAKAAYVYDVVNEKILYEKNAQDVLPLASLTKVMAAVIAREELPRDTVVTVHASDIRAEGDTGLLSGERWKLPDIIGFTLMTSSNDGASALATAAGSLGQSAYDVQPDDAREAFVRKMNEKALSLGLRGTRFFNGTGLDLDGEVSGGYGTAHDMGQLMAYALHAAYEDISITALPKASITSLNNITHHSTNTNESIGVVPNIIASKTGYTDLAGGNLVIAFDAGVMRPIIVVVLGSTREGRFTDVEKLGWAALEAITP